MKNETVHRSLVADFLESRGNRAVENVLSLVVGVGLLSALAQLSIRLPWTLVPITGQTFGVAFIALTWGRSRAVSIVLSYLAVGAMGMPVFAGLRSGLSLSPTLGYLIGMIFSSLIVGTFADRGWGENFFKAWAAATCGSLATFACGLAVLSQFVPTQDLLMAGFLPFLPGDLIKNISASLLVSRANRMVQK